VSIKLPIPDAQKLGSFCQNDRRPALACDGGLCRLELELRRSDGTREVLSYSPTFSYVKSLAYMVNN
jgi:hypothetical protein